MTEHSTTSDLHGHLHDVPREARAFQGDPAGVVTRGMAAGVDALMVLLVGVLIWLASGALVFILRPTHFTFPSPTLGFAMISLGVIGWVYLTAGWAASGRTAGNQLLGLRVVTARGRRVPWTVAALRAVAYLFFPVGLFWSAVSSKRRSLQDIVLRTRVVYDWRRLSSSQGDARVERARTP